MKADVGRRYRLYPMPEQAERLVAWGHTCRALWNLALEQRRYAWHQRKVTLRSAAQCRELTAARAEVAWIADLPAQCGQQVLRQLDAAYDNWWNPAHPAGAPRFKKRRARLAVPFAGQAVKVRKLNRHWAEAWLPRIGWVRFRLSRALGGAVRNAAVTVDAAGHWHVSFGLASGVGPTPPNGLPGAGVDFGVSCSAFVSTESAPRLMPPSLAEDEQRRLNGLERRRGRQLVYARKHNGGKYGNRLRKTIAKIADLKARQARRRMDFTHKLTRDLTQSHGWVAIEDLRVRSMTATARGTAMAPGSRVAQKAGLNAAILDNVPGKRRRQLEYKTRWYGSQLRLVDPAGTSQTCPACLHRDPASRQGCGRVFACTACGHVDHADRTASLEIYRRGVTCPRRPHLPPGGR